MPIFPHQPERSRVHPTLDRTLRFTTMPKERGNKVSICTFRSQITQMRLYRAVCQGDVPRQVSISDLYEFAFYDVKEIVSKRQMGTIVVQSVMYEPRVLMNNAMVGKPTMSYVFGDVLELQYGLEWMLSAWLLKFLNSTAASGEAIGTIEEFAEELDMLGGSDRMTYMDVYELPLKEIRKPFPEPIWEDDQGEELILDLPKEVVQPPRPRALG